MNGERLAILSVNFHSHKDGTDYYAVQLNHPAFPAPLGPPPLKVSPADRQAIAERIEQITREMSEAELSANSDSLKRLGDTLRGLGKLLCNTYIPAEIREVLRDVHYPLALSTELNDLPWELLHPGGDDYLALRVPLVRSPVVPRYKDGAVRELLRTRPLPFKAMLASNPGQPPLPMVADEVATIARLLLSQEQVGIWRMGQDMQDSVALRAGLADGQFTIIHFAGHGYFNADDPTQSFFNVLAASGREEPITASSCIKIWRARQSYS